MMMGCGDNGCRVELSEDVQDDDKCEDHCRMRRLVNALCDVLVARGMITNADVLTAFELVGRGICVEERIEVLRDLFANNK